jgi:putative transposase
MAFKASVNCLDRCQVWPRPCHLHRGAGRVGRDRRGERGAWPGTASTGELLSCPGLTGKETFRKVRLQRRLARARRGSNRRAVVKAELARLSAREAGRRRDWCEKTSTDLARRFDVICVEGLSIKNMTRSARGTVEQPGRNVAAKTGLNLYPCSLSTVHHVNHDLFNSRD